MNSGTRIRRILLPFVLAWGSVAAPPPGAPPASASFMIPAPPWRPKEAALVRHDGLFHLYYTRGMRTVPFDSTWRDLGHATSPDLVNWTELAPVLPRRPGAWDNHQVWSPCVVTTRTVRDGLRFWMFYTGLTHRADTVRHQRIGLAISTDLVNWKRLDAPIFSCAEVPWTHCDPTRDGAGDFRDPWVMPDPDSAGHWLMFYTTRHRETPGEFIIGLARSRGDLTRWHDVGPMWNTTSRRTWNAVVETPDVLRHGDLWYLFYTTWNARPIWFQTAASPVADSSGWSVQTSLASEVPSLYSDPSFGPEHYGVDGHDLYYMPNSLVDGIQFLEFTWQDPPHFELVEPWTAVSVPAPGGLRPLALRPRMGPGEARLTLELPGASPAELWIADVGGRRVRGLLGGVLAAGATECRWDLRDDAGRRAPAGVYFAVLATPAGRRAARLVVLP